MAKRVYVTCDIGKAALDRLREKGYEVEVHPHEEAPSKELIIEKVASGIDGLISSIRDPIDAEIFEAGKGTLRVVSQVAVGFDNINRADANKYGVPFTNTADVLTEATAEFAFFMMGAVARKLWSSERLVRENRWNTWHLYLPFLGDDVTEKTIAVIGTGRIGRALIKKCLGFGMDIVCFDTFGPDHKYMESVQKVMDAQHEHGIQKRRATIKYAEFEDALGQADFVSVHVPLLRAEDSKTPTYHLFNQVTLRKMKPTAYLINTSRGPVIDEVALAQALRESWIKGAALDVFEHEPLSADSPLRDPALEDRCRLFPHLGSGTTTTRLSPDPEIGMAGRCVQALLDVVEGNYGGDLTKMPHVVNKEAFQKH